MTKGVHEMPLWLKITAEAKRETTPCRNCNPCDVIVENLNLKTKRQLYIIGETTSDSQSIYLSIYLIICLSLSLSLSVYRWSVTILLSLSFLLYIYIYICIFAYLHSLNICIYWSVYMHHHWGCHHWGHHGQACLRRSAMLETLSDEQISQLADASGVPGGPRGSRGTCTVTRRGLVHMASWGKHRKTLDGNQRKMVI